MSATVVDSSVLIDYLRGKKEALAYLERLQVAGDLQTHAIVVAEVLSGARDRREQDAIMTVLREFRMTAPNEADCMAALNLLRKHRLASGVEWNDCLIGSTCLRLGLPVATLNEKHFRVFESLTVIRPY